MTENKDIDEILTEEEIEELKQEGYTPLEVVGEGNTRYVIEALYKKGDFQEKRVVKIPKSENEIDKNSICTLINLSKGDPNRKELVCASEIGYHPNVIKVIDNIKVNGKIANIEECLIGNSLEDLIKNKKPFFKRKDYQKEDKELFEQIFKGIIKGMQYLNEERRILHRDIKPSNILIDWKGQTKITDLQNSTQIEEFPDHELLPTRGGTVCTHPKLLNAVVNGEKTYADKKTELYAFGATMYYALTGKYPFSYNLVYDENGTEIDLGNNKIRIALRNNGNKIKRISKEDHEKELKNALKEIPWQYKKLLRRCLSLDSKFKEFSILGDISKEYNIDQLEKDFEKACKSKRQKILEQVKKRGPLVSLIAFLTFIGGYGLGKAINSAHNVTSPTLQELLMTRDADPTYTTKEFNINEDSKEHLKEEIEEVKGKLSKYSKGEIEKILEDARFIAPRSPGVDERLMNALILTCALEDEKVREKFAKEERRVDLTLVPNSFVLNCIWMDPYSWTDEKHLNSFINSHQKILWAVKYLMQNYNFGDDVADVFAKYFCSREELAIAMQNTSNCDYFPKIGTGKSPVLNYDLPNTHLEGYGSRLPRTEKKLTDRALALYFLMDENGNFIEASPSKD